MLSKKEVDSQSYRDAMSRFAGAVHVVTTDGTAGRRGVTIIAGCSVSDDPPTVLVCLSRNNAKNDVFAQNGNFALNTLAGDADGLAGTFAGFTAESQDERFAKAEWTVLSSGAPVLKGAKSVFDCTIEHVHDHATHRVLFGRVVGLAVGPSLDPLIYYNRDFRRLSPVGPPATNGKETVR